MPTRPQRPCRKPGCASLTTEGYCDAHKQAATQTYDRWRGSAYSRGYDAAWSKVRAIALRRDCHLCIECQRNGKLTPAQDVDHIQPISQRPELRLTLSNLQSLCRSCHNEKTRREHA